jgi:hypothetical protein
MKMLLKKHNKISLLLIVVLLNLLLLLLLLLLHLVCLLIYTSSILLPLRAERLGIWINRGLLEALLINIWCNHLPAHVSYLLLLLLLLFPSHKLTDLVRLKVWRIYLSPLARVNLELSRIS